MNLCKEWKEVDIKKILNKLVEQQKDSKHKKKIEKLSRKREQNAEIR